jgi:superfamily I DNA/RNA helicase
VFFDEKGHIVPLRIPDRRASKGKKAVYKTGIYGDSTKDSMLSYDNTLLFKDYGETFDKFLAGTDGCKSKETCKKECKFYELCNYNHQPVAKNEAVVEKKAAVEPALNREQQEVVDFRKGICCVDAGPGSGKTQCMAYRIARLLVEETKPEEILVMSFSKAAVKVITDRVKFFVWDVYGMFNIDTSRIKVATFNSLGNELIEKFYKELGYTEIPELIDEVEMFNLVKDSIDFTNPVEGFDYKNYKMKSMNRNMPGGVVAAITREIEGIRSDNLSKETYFDTVNCYSNEQKEYIWETNERYSQKMVENNLIDYSDQQYQVLRLIDEINPDAITDTYNYKNIIVDEFQDSNDFQMVFISELINTAKFESLMVVGDDAQAIYGFRGTTPDNIINFEDKLNTFVPVTEFTLGRNYRSTEEIVELGNEVLSHNKTKIQKVLTSHRGKSGNKPVFKGFEKSKDEISYICDNIEKLISDGVSKNEIAVICATKAALKTVSKELSARGILSQYDMGERLLDNSRVRAAIGFCNFVTDTNGTRGLLEYLNEVYNDRLFEVFTPEKVQQLLDRAKEDFINNYLPLTLDEKKDYLLKALLLLDDGTDAIYTDFVERVKNKGKLNVFQILNYIRDFYELDINATAEKSGKYDAVALVTAHSSKGKEWEHCFVSLTNFDNVPARTLEEREEKRRLIFVAYTRAKTGLTVTSLRNKEKEGDYIPVNPWYAEMKNYASFDNRDNENARASESA